MDYQYDYFYRRNLPHIQPPDASYFVTYRLAGSIPKAVLERLKTEWQDFERKLLQVNDESKRIGILRNERKKYFKKYDEILDKILSGPVWLKNEKVASLISEAIHYCDGKKYILDAFTIKPNHVHMVFYVERNEVSPYIVTDILQSLKRYTAMKCNRILNRSGQFWQRESYDHVVRNNRELIRIIKYVLNNPVKAGFVERPEQWKWSYCREDIMLNHM